MSKTLPGAAESKALLAKVANGLITLPYEAWNFGDSVGFEAMVAASQTLGDDRWLAFATGFIRGWATHRRPFTRADNTAPGLAMVDAYRATSDARVLEAALDLADYLASRPTIEGVYITSDQAPLQHPCGSGHLSAADTVLLVHPPGGVFVDCLHFDPPFFTALGEETGDDRWTELGITQAMGYVALLQAESGLFDHFVLKSTGRRYGPGWGRGQGWALLGLLDVLSRMPQADGRRAALETSARAVISSMISCQRPDGHWNAVVHDSTSGVESSTAAFMSCAFARAQHLGITDGEAIAASGRRALAAALAMTSKEGILKGVSAAVNACTQPSHYAAVPRDFYVPWGQGPLALALVEHLRRADEDN
jgi:unsaturated rhamnogalacturonyl hydrolase